VLPTLLGLQVPLAAYQTPRGPAGFPRPADLRIAAGEQAHTMLRPLDALSRFEGVLRTDSANYDALWRASREAVDLGMLATRRDVEARWYGRAERYGRRAVRLRPAGVEGLEWLAITLGREALDEGPRQKVRLALEIRGLALKTLVLDPRSAAAHHILGMWNAEVRRLSGITRWTARKFLRAEVFREASWAEAERHLRAAVRLDPGGLIHHLDLAEVYLDLHRPEEARRELREVLERPAVEPTDPLLKERARDLLAAR